MFFMVNRKSFFVSQKKNFLISWCGHFAVTGSQVNGLMAVGLYVKDVITYNAIPLWIQLLLQDILKEYWNSAIKFESTRLNVFDDTSTWWRVAQFTTFLC